MTMKLGQQREIPENKKWIKFYEDTRIPEITE